MMTSIKRIVKSGLFNFWRNGYVSLASVFVMVVMSLVIGATVLSGVVLDYTLNEIRNKVDINVYFFPDARESEILDLKASIEQLPETKSVEYQSRDVVLAEFRERHADDQITISALEELEDNPLGAQLNISAQNPSQYASIAEFLATQSASRGDGFIDNVNFNENRDAITTLSNIIDTVDRLGLIVSIVVVVAAILITFNTIRLAIFISRDEIGVMRLVGASTAYIRGPFMVTGIIYGVIAGVISLLILLPVTWWVGTVTGEFFGDFNMFAYYVSNMYWIGGVLLGSGIVVGALSSYLAVRKYITF